VLLNQLPLPDLPETLITSLVFLHRVHPITILQAFLFFWHRHPATLVCCILGQQAFNAATTLAVDAWETYSEENEGLVNEACTIFFELQNTGVHELAKMAFRHISAGLTHLQHRRQKREAAEASRSHPLSSYSPVLVLDSRLPHENCGDTAGSHAGIFQGQSHTYASTVPPFTEWSTTNIFGLNLG
jgi:hypothetical protein